MSTTVRKLSTVDETRALGHALADVARAGDLILLIGPLGAGKTALAQGLGAGLDVKGEVTSPTFVIARSHRGGRLPLVHVDAYRLGGRLELDDLDLDSDVADSVTVVEWGEGVAEQLSDAHLEVRLTRLDDDTRTAQLIPRGSDWQERIAGLP